MTCCIWHFPFGNYRFHSLADHPMTTRKLEIIDGFKLFLPLMVATAPFALLFGAVAAEKGLSTAEIVFMSASVFAGASQYVALDLWGYP